MVATEKLVMYAMHIALYCKKFLSFYESNLGWYPEKANELGENDF